MTWCRSLAEKGIYEDPNTSTTTRCRSRRNTSNNAAHSQINRKLKKNAATHFFIAKTAHVQFGAGGEGEEGVEDK